MVASPSEFSVATRGITLLRGGAPDFPLAGTVVAINLIGDVPA
ncbi:hypothetical protein O6072_22030 [Mycolicibacterium neoaurum]|nr:hypothetical protein [Mycolicibacterium neoaurum]WBP93733.1 hypothetical protein O7W24_21760 [Mycolicibacterium neoaurum]WBS07490.1 hypothetical protein O6072_22030 [Mycolicibacterium neoaurum]